MGLLYTSYLPSRVKVLDIPSIIRRTAWFGSMAIIITDCCHSTRAGPADEPAGAEGGVGDRAGVRGSVMVE